MNGSTQILSGKPAVERQSGFTSDSFGSIEIDGDLVTLDNFEFRSPDVACHLAQLPSDEQPAAFALIAIEDAIRQCEVSPK